MCLAREGRLFVTKPAGWPVALAVMLASGTAFAGSPLAPGDGSGASNAQLFSPVAMSDGANWTPAPVEEIDPFFAIDWSLATKGSFIRDSSGDRFEASFSPSASFSHVGTRLNFAGKADATFTKDQDGPFNVDALSLSGTSSFKINDLAKLDSHASISRTQEDVHAADVSSGVTSTPIQLSGAADTAFTQQFGRFDLSVKANAGRDTYGPTTLSGGTEVDNTSENNTHVGAGLRLGFELTPVLEPFVDAEGLRTVFDAPSTSLGTKLDGNQYTLMAGIDAKWTGFTASASAGVGIAHFDDSSLADVRATLFDASLAYRPTEALALTGDFSTAIAPPGPNGSGTAQVNYKASAGAAYLVNEWLGWRLSAAWHNTTYAEATTTDTGYDLGIGADYLVNDHAKLSADYAFSHSEITPNPATDTHMISLGLTVKR